MCERMSEGLRGHLPAERGNEKDHSSYPDAPTSGGERERTVTALCGKISPLFSPFSSPISPLLPIYVCVCVGSVHTDISKQADERGGALTKMAE